MTKINRVTVDIIVPVSSIIRLMKNVILFVHVEPSRTKLRKADVANVMCSLMQKQQRKQEKALDCYLQLHALVEHLKLEERS